MLVYTSRSGAAGNKVDLSSPQGYVQQSTLENLPDALLTPGPANTELRSVPNGLGLVAIAWRSDTGDRGVYLQDYLLDPRTAGNVADAIELALTENPSASALYLPGGNLSLTRTVDNFTGSGGLRSNLAFIGVPGSTKFVQVGTFTPFFAFPTSTENVTWSGVQFEVSAPVAFSIAIQAYMPRNWIVDKSAFRCTVASNFNGANAALALLGATNCRVTNCFSCAHNADSAAWATAVAVASSPATLVSTSTIFSCPPCAAPPLRPAATSTFRTCSSSTTSCAVSSGPARSSWVAMATTRRIAVQGIVIANNTFVGTMEGVAGAGARAYIIIVAGVTGARYRGRGQHHCR